MHSHLTRLVFRRLINGRPIIHRDCVITRALLRRCNAAPSPHTTERRHFGLVDLFQPDSDARKRKQTPMLPGLATMVRLRESELLQARPPEPGELLDALKSFCKAKNDLCKGLSEMDVLEKGRGLTETEARHILGTLSFLKEGGKTWRGADVPQLEMEGLLDVMQTMLPDRDLTTSTHQALARALIREVEPRTEGSPPEQADGSKSPDGDADGRVHVPARTKAKAVIMLCKVGLPNEANRLIRDWKSDDDAPAAPWFSCVIRCYKNGRSQDEESTVEETLRLMRDHGIPQTPKQKRNLAVYYARRDNVDAAMHWVRQLDDDAVFQPYAVAVVLNAHGRLGRERDGRQLVETYMEKYIHSKQFWIAAFRFSASLGRGVEEVDRMLRVMRERVPEDGNLTVDNDVINDLVKHAVARRDSYLAERFFALGLQWGVEPDLESYVLQMEYRVAVDDLDGALTAYDKVKTYTSPEEGGAKNSTRTRQNKAVNLLIQAMAAARGRYPVAAIMRIVDELADVKGHFFEADTISALCSLHLKRDEYKDVIELLQQHTSRFTTPERDSIRDSFVAFCLDRRNHINKVWDAYMVFRRFFVNEIPRATRERLMNEFMARRRADMAFHVFEHMRTHHVRAFRPTRDTYVDAFMGAGVANRDEQTLEQMINLLKLDQDVEPDTRLRNAIILAYSAVDEVGYSWNFWDDIVNSREGPSYNSIVIALRSCELGAQGEIKGKGIWDRLVELDVEITLDLYTAWACCLAGRAQLRALRKLLQDAAEYGFTVDTRMICNVFTAMGNYGTKHIQVASLDAVADLHPDVLQQVVKVGVEEEFNWLQIDYPVQVAEMLQIGLKPARNTAYAVKGLDRTLKP